MLSEITRLGGSIIHKNETAIQFRSSGYLNRILIRSTSSLLTIRLYSSITKSQYVIFEFVYMVRSRKEKVKFCHQPHQQALKAHT